MFFLVGGKRPMGCRCLVFTIVAVVVFRTQVCEGWYKDSLVDWAATSGRRNLYALNIGVDSPIDEVERRELRRKVCKDIKHKLVGHLDPKSGKEMDDFKKINLISSYERFQEVMKDLTNKDAIRSYADTLIRSFLPSLLAVVILFIVLPGLGIAACCRCCRQCCIFYPEPDVVQHRKTCGRCSFVIIVAFLCTGVVFCCCFAFKYNAEAHKGFNKTMCAMYEFSEETLFGKEDEALSGFMGIYPAHARASSLLQDFSAEPSPDPKDPTLIDQVELLMDKTTDFSKDLSLVSERLDFLVEVANANEEVAQQQDHVCHFCASASTAAITAKEQLDKGVTGAVESARKEMASTFGRKSKTFLDISSSVNSSVSALLQTIDSFSDKFAHAVDTGYALSGKVETARYVTTLVMAVFGLVLAVFTTLIILIQFLARVENPHPCGALTSWCCFSFVSFLALLFGGFSMTIGVVTSHTCYFLREEFQSFNGISPYSNTFGFTDQTLDVVNECLTREGTGDLLAALHLRSQLTFKNRVAQVYSSLDSVEDQKFDASAFNGLNSLAEDIGPLVLPDPKKLSRKPTYQDLFLISIFYNEVKYTVGRSEVIPVSLRNLEINGLQTLQNTIRTTTDIAARAENLGNTGYFFFDLIFPGTRAPTDIVSQADKDRYRMTSTFSPEDPKIQEEAEKLFPNKLVERRAYSNMIYWAAKKNLLASTPKFDCRLPANPDIMTLCVFEGPNITGQTRFVDYIKNSLTNPVALATQDLATTVEAARTTLTSDMKQLVNGTIIAADELIDGSNCQFVMKGFNAILDGVCSNMIHLLVRIAVCACLGGSLCFILIFFLYAVITQKKGKLCYMLLIRQEWRFNLDNRLLQKEGKFGDNPGTTKTYPSSYANSHYNEAQRNFSFNKGQRNSMVMV